MPSAPTSPATAFLRNWLPLVLWCFAIAVESTDMMSAGHTGGLLSLILDRYLHLALSDESIALLNLLLRKAGHIIGYAVMSLLFFRAYRNHLRWRHGLSSDSPRSDGWNWCWRAQWALLGVMFAVLVATADELHQMTIPSRTGTWHDIVLDTSAAIVAQILLWKWLARRHATVTS
ncbi:MAG TPA: VanZ family protein [Terriglobales bacterium]